MYHDEVHYRGDRTFTPANGDDEASTEIETIRILAGQLPPRAVRLVTEWATEHREDHLECKCR